MTTLAVFPPNNLARRNRICAAYEILATLAMPWIGRIISMDSGGEGDKRMPFEGGITWNMLRSAGQAGCRSRVRWMSSGLCGDDRCRVYRSPSRTAQSSFATDRAQSRLYQGWSNYAVCPRRPRSCDRCGASPLRPSGDLRWLASR